VPEKDVVFAICPSCGENTFAVYEDKEFGLDKIKGKCFACGAEKKIRF
jgi:Zn finger protein HypA/HybF involved in hydrogenase expression